MYRKEKKDTEKIQYDLVFFLSGAIINVTPVLGGVWFTLYRRCLGSHIRFSRRNTLRLVRADMVHR